MSQNFTRPVGPNVIDIENITKDYVMGEETVRALRGVVPSGRTEDLASGTPLAHPLHPVLVGIPIGTWTAVPVLDEMKRLVGLLTPENVSELMMVQSALPRRRGRGRRSRRLGGGSRRSTYRSGRTAVSCRPRLGRVVVVLQLLEIKSQGVCLLIPV